MLEYRKDCSIYQSEISEIQEVLNIGWLDEKESFSTGEVSTEFRNKLKRILIECNNSLNNVTVNRVRGFNSCPVCGKGAAFLASSGIVLTSSRITGLLDLCNDDEIHILGSREVWVPNLHRKNNFFAAYDLIYHHIFDHHYLPPKEFIESVLSFGFDSSYNAEKEYANCIRKYYPDYLSFEERFPE
jgi:hypothetical protein